MRGDTLRTFIGANGRPKRKRHKRAGKDEYQRESGLLGHGNNRRIPGARRGRLTPNLAREYARTHVDVTDVVRERVDLASLGSDPIVAAAAERIWLERRRVVQAPTKTDIRVTHHIVAPFLEVTR